MIRKGLICAMLCLALLAGNPQMLIAASNQEIPKTDNGIEKEQNISERASVSGKCGTIDYRIDAFRLISGAGLPTPEQDANVWIYYYDNSTGQGAYLDVPGATLAIDRNLGSAKLAINIPEGKIELEWNAVSSVISSQIIEHRDNSGLLTFAKSLSRDATVSGSFLGNSVDRAGGVLVRHRLLVLTASDRDQN